ncbi:ATP-binding protein [uncultured Jatrophihabitans sp.]|uniref:ATP-binding protein n=1 Tax=uncultured Jatrophihabitans sp. TaxID=1610747 RepID=UPI0035CA055D
MTSFVGTQADTLQVRSEGDVVMARRRVRDRARDLGLDLVNQTKIVTAASELARNTLVYGGGGEVVIDVVEDASTARTGLRLAFRDNGPGITDIERALAGGWTTGQGLGLGLSGSRNLVSVFELTSSSEGTEVVVVVWRRSP